MRGVALILAVVACHLTSTYSRPTFKAYLGHDGLSVPVPRGAVGAVGTSTSPVAAAFAQQANGKLPGPVSGHVKHSYHHTAVDGRGLHLDMEGDLSTDGVIHLDSDVSVDQVHCDFESGQLTVFFAKVKGTPGSAPLTVTAESLGWAPQQLIVGGRQWGCVDEKTGKTSTILRRITAIAVSGSGYAILDTVAAGLHHVYRNLDMKYACNQYPTDTTNTTTHLTEASDELLAKHDSALHSSRRLDFWSWLGGSIASVADDVYNGVVDAGKAIVTAVSFVFTGSVNTNSRVQLAAFNWNYEPSTGSASKVYDMSDSSNQVSAVCRNCFAAADVMLFVNIQVSDYSLQYGLVALQGNVDMSLDLSIMSEMDVNLYSFQVPVADISLGQVDIPLVVPLAVDFSVPIFAGVGLTLIAQAPSRYMYRRTEQVTYGLQYLPSTGLEWYHDHATTHQYGITPVTNYDISLNIDAWMQPNLRVEVEKLLWGEVGIRLHALLDLSASNTNPSCSVGASLSGRVVFALSAGVNIIDVSWGPKMWPMWTGQVAAMCFVSPTGSQAVGSVIPVVTNDNANLAVYDSDLTFLPSNVYEAASGEGAITSASASAAGEENQQRRRLSQPVIINRLSAREPVCQSQCQIATGLKACAPLNGKSVCTSMTAQQMQTADASILTAAKTSAQTAGPACADSLAAHLCALMFPTCQQATDSNSQSFLDTISHEQCESAYSICVANPNLASHACAQCEGNPFCPVSSAAVPPAPGSSLAAAPVSTATATCQVVPSTMAFCDHLAGQSVYLRSDLYQSLDAADRAAAAFFDVLARASSRCLQTTKLMACQRVLPSCDPVTVQPLPLCYKTCIDAFETCGNATFAATACSEGVTTGDIQAPTSSAACGLTSVAVSAVTVGGPLRSASVQNAPASSDSAWSPHNWSVPSLVIGAAVIAAFAGIATGLIAVVVTVRRRALRQQRISQRSVITEWDGMTKPNRV